VPFGGGHLLVPDIVPLEGRLLAYLRSSGQIATAVYDRFQAFRLPDALTGADLEIGFVGGVTLIDVERVDGPELTLITRWRSEGDQLPDLKVAVHLLDAEGKVLAQHDGLDCPAYFWRPGDEVVQLHRLRLPGGTAPNRYALRIGLYDRQTLVPYLLLDGRPFYDAGVIDVDAP
jgi:hypothetical protein